MFNYSNILKFKVVENQENNHFKDCVILHDHVKNMFTNDIDMMHA